MPPARKPALRGVASILGRGTLRLALFPSFFYRREAGEPCGVGVTIASALADRIGVPLASTEYASPPKVVEALALGAADVALLGIDPSRAAEVGFSPPLLSADFTYLVPEASSVRAIADADRPGLRIALVRHHAMDTALTLTDAERVYCDTPDAAFDLFRAGGADALAGIRPGLALYARALVGARVLDGCYGRNVIALAVNKGDPDWFACVGEFADQARRDGTVRAAIAQAGLVGVQAD